MSRRDRSGDGPVPSGWVMLEGQAYEVHLVPAGTRTQDLAKAETSEAAVPPQEPDSGPAKAWWTRREVADYLRRSLSWVDHQRVLRRHRIGNRVVFKAEDVRDFVETSPRRGQLVPLPRRRS